MRYYEEQGLLTSDRTPGGQRRYADNAVDRVVRIQELFAAGLSSTKIARILPCMRDADGGPSEIATPKLITGLTSERDRIDRDNPRSDQHPSRARRGHQLGIRTPPIACQLWPSDRAPPLVAPVPTTMNQTATSQPAEETRVHVVPPAHYGSGHALG